jgi:hypothetical protein
MAQLLNASICLTDLVERFKTGHSAFNRGKTNGKVYVNLTEWINEEPDKFGNHASFKLNSSKEKKDEEKAANGGKDIYVGSGKLVDIGGGEPVKAGSTEFDGLGIQGNGANASAEAVPQEAAGDLPF